MAPFIAATKYNLWLYSKLKLTTTSQKLALSQKVSIQNTEYPFEIENLWLCFRVCPFLRLVLGLEEFLKRSVALDGARIHCVPG